MRRDKAGFQQKPFIGHGQRHNHFGGHNGAKVHHIGGLHGGQKHFGGNKAIHHHGGFGWSKHSSSEGYKGAPIYDSFETKIDSMYLGYAPSTFLAGTYTFSGN